MNTLPFITAIKEYDEKFYELLKSLQETIFEESALDIKTKLMISMAVDACMGAEEGVRSIAESLRRMGVTDAQIAEVLRISYFAKGNMVITASNAAFEK